MGYKPNKKIFKLRFEDEEYAGLIVKAKSVKLGSFLGVASLTNLDTENIGPEDMEKFTGLFKAFATALVEWNLEDEDTGEPVPATLEGIQSQDVDFIMPIIKAWFGAIAGVSGPLGQRSPNGEQSPEPGIPMEPR